MKYLVVSMLVLTAGCRASWPATSGESRAFEDGYAEGQAECTDYRRYEQSCSTPTVIPTVPASMEVCAVTRVTGFEFVTAVDGNTVEVVVNGARVTVHLQGLSDTSDNFWYLNSTGRDSAKYLDVIVQINPLEWVGILRDPLGNNLNTKTAF